MKNILICFDGTGNEYGCCNTNVVRTCECAVADGEQRVFYEPGIGTVRWRFVRSLLKAGYRKVTGKGLQDNVEGGYRFLMEHYEVGDRVYLFGFSRGAFTARSLGGMLHHCGLLRRGLGNLVGQASKIYNRPDGEIQAGFKSVFCRPCPVHFIGVWDTVKSLLMNEGRRFHDARLGSEVRHGYHALALDEQRRHFSPLLWDESQVDPARQTIEQVWFAGAHADVGGGYEDHRGLSDLSLHWMMKKAQDAGLKLRPGALDALQGDPHGRLHVSYKGKWRLFGKHTRKVAPGALVHDSVRQRMESGMGYEPMTELGEGVRFVGGG